MKELDLRAGHTIWTEDRLAQAILAETERRQIDYVEAAHRVLRGTLGDARYTRARLAMLGGRWEHEDLLICRRIALQLCRYFGPGEAVSLEKLDRLIPSLLMTEAELDAGLRNTRQTGLEQVAAWNTLPC